MQARFCGKWVTGTQVGTKWELKREPFYMMKKINHSYIYKALFPVAPLGLAVVFMFPPAHFRSPVGLRLAGGFVCA
jgi:hypothetical protein